VIGYIQRKLLVDMFCSLRPNRKFFEVLFPIFGFDMGEYENRLSGDLNDMWMYPYLSLRQALVKMKQMSDRCNAATAERQQLKYDLCETGENS